MFWSSASPNLFISLFFLMLSSNQTCFPEEEAIVTAITEAGWSGSPRHSRVKFRPVPIARRLPPVILNWSLDLCVSYLPRCRSPVLRPSHVGWASLVTQPRKSHTIRIFLLQSPCKQPRSCFSNTPRVMGIFRGV